MIGQKPIVLERCDVVKIQLGMVKWYHSCFGSMRRKFDSSYRDQIFINKNF